MFQKYTVKFTVKIIILTYGFGTFEYFRLYYSYDNFKL